MRQSRGPAVAGVAALVLFLTLVTLTGCATDYSRMDSGLLTGKPCRVPCWNGLTPGVSTASDVDRFVQGLSLKTWPARDTLVYDTGCRLVKIADKPGTPVNAFVDMHVDNGKLVYIESVHDHMPSLQQIVDHLGPPEYFEALHVIGPDGEAYMLDIYYPQQGVVFGVFVNLKDLGFIRPEMLVSGIEYYEPGDLFSYFLARYACSLGEEGAASNAPIHMAMIQPWSGFGTVTPIQTH